MVWKVSTEATFCNTNKSLSQARTRRRLWPTAVKMTLAASPSRPLRWQRPSQFVSGIVSSLGATNVERTESGARTSQAERSLTEAPPLLLVRVYQDTMAALFKVDADFAGAKNREAHLGTELLSVNKELAALSSREAEYNRKPRPDAGGDRCRELCEADHRRADQHAYRACELRNWPVRQIFPPFANRSFSWRWA
jgi:hypothetical protein